MKLLPSWHKFCVLHTTMHQFTVSCQKKPNITLTKLSNHPKKPNITLAGLTSKHARSNPHLIQIGSEALARSGPDDYCSSTCFWTGSIWPKPNIVSQNPIRSGLVLHNMIRAICGRTQQSLKVEISSKPVAFCQTGPDKSCTLACFRTRCVCPKPHPAIQIGSGSVFHNMILAFFGRTEPNWMQEVGSGIHNLARFWLFGWP